MFFWAYAEISIGTIVSCLPVLPKFFRHFGPKVYSVLFTKSTPNSYPDDRTFLHEDIKYNQRSSSTDTEIQPYPPLAQIKNARLTLDIHDSMLMERLSNPNCDSHDSCGPTTKRGDLEIGRA